jgi:hypothetical protein
VGHGGSFHHLGLRSNNVESVADKITDAAKSSSRVPSRSLTAASDSSPSFWDFLDVINPLQHIPIINSVYRNLTGDHIGAVARTIGGGLFGGPMGLVASVFENMVVQTSGKDFGEQIAGLFGGDDDKSIDQLDERTKLAGAAASGSVATGAPLDLTIRPSDIPDDVAPMPAQEQPPAVRQNLAQADIVPNSVPPIPVPIAVAPTVTAPIAAEKDAHLLQASGSFMPLNDKVRHVAKGTKFRNMAGLSTSRIFNPKNEISDKAQPVATSVEPVENAKINKPLDQPTQVQTQQNFPQASPPVDLSVTMLKALEKYQTMDRLGQPKPPLSVTASP